MMTYVMSELEGAKHRKTPLAPAVSQLFRKFVRKAEEPQRVAGAWPPHARCLAPVCARATVPQP